MSRIPHALIALSLLVSVCSHAGNTIPITVAPLSDWSFHPAADAPAVVVALRTTRIPSELNARVSAMEAEVGDYVSQGQVIAKLDCTLFSNSLQRSRAQGQALDAQISLARQQLDRTHRLVRQRSASEELVDQREADLKRLLADRRAQNAVIATADNDVNHCIIKAPYHGTITQRMHSIGDYVTTGAALFTILDPRAVELEADVPYEQLPSLRSARTIEFEREYPVILRATLPTVSTRTGQQAIRLSFIDARPLAGITGRIRWKSPETAVPAELLVRRDDRLGIFVVDSDKARFHVLSNALEGRPASVQLPADTQLIIDGREAVTDGQAVKVIPAE